MELAASSILSSLIAADDTCISSGNILAQNGNILAQNSTIVKIRTEFHQDLKTPAEGGIF